jgi:hypothetical protein
MSKSETKETKKKTSDSDEVNPGLSSNGKKMGRPFLAWDKKAENAGPAKLFVDLNEKISEKRLESKKRKRRAPDEEIKDAMEVVLDKNYDIDTGVATLATMEIKAEIGRRLVAQRTANVEKKNLVTSLKNGMDFDFEFNHENPKAFIKALAMTKGRNIIRMQQLLELAQAQLSFVAQPSIPAFVICG